MGNITFVEKQYEKQLEKARQFFIKNPELVNALNIPKEHLNRIIIAKRFGFYGNYGQPAFFEMLKAQKDYNRVFNHVDNKKEIKKGSTTEKNINRLENKGYTIVFDKSGKILATKGQQTYTANSITALINKIL